VGTIAKDGVEHLARIERRRRSVGLDKIGKSRKKGAGHLDANGDRRRSGTLRSSSFCAVSFVTAPTITC